VQSHRVGLEVQLLVTLADPKLLDWGEKDEFWKTVDEAKEFFKEQIYAVILTTSTGRQDPKYRFVCAFTPEPDIEATFKAVLKDAELVAMLRNATHVEIEISSSVPKREQFLEWLDANGAQRAQ
jgi:hypothetical protein